MSLIQILSDLHLEAPQSYDVFEITPTAPHLALIGDIGCVKDDGYFEFIEKLLYKFSIVFLVLGNHEPYHCSWTVVRQKIRQFEKGILEKHPESGLGRFILLDQTRFDISPQTTILGCVLYSNVLPSQTESVSFGINDFYHIEDWTVDAHKEAHAADLSWLNTQVTSISAQEPERNIIIFSHYSPTLSKESIDQAHSKSCIISAFSSDLSQESCWTNASVKVWAFGHTHFNCDYTETGSGKRVITNQRGYYFRQAEGFDERKCIEV